MAYNSEGCWKVGITSGKRGRYWEVFCTLSNRTKLIACIYHLHIHRHIHDTRFMLVFQWSWTSPNLINSEGLAPSVYPTMSADPFREQTMPLGSWRCSGHGAGPNGSNLEAAVFANMLCKQMLQPQTLLCLGVRLVSLQQGYLAGLQE